MILHAETPEKYAYSYLGILSFAKYFYMIHHFSKFQQLEEANTQKASNFELYIKQALNHRTKNMVMTDVPTRAGAKALAIADTVLQSLNSKGIHTAEFVHMGGTKGPLSDFYTAQGATDGTSKADIRSTDNRFRFSLKNSGGAALASGSQAEQRAAFYWTLSAHPNPTNSYHKIGEEILGLVEKYMADIPLPKGIEKVINVKRMTSPPGFFSGRRKPGVLDAMANPKTQWSTDIKAWLKEIEQRDYAMKETIGKQLEVTLASDSSFRRFYTFECATGQGKFGDTHLTGPSTANYMLLFAYDGRARVDVADNPDAPIIQTYAKNMKFRFRWKHGAKTRVSLDLTKKFFRQELPEHHTASEFWLYESRNFARQLLTENLWNDVQSLRARFTNWLTATIQKFKAAVVRALSVGLNAVLEFFGLSVDTIETTWPNVQI